MLDTSTSEETFYGYDIRGNLLAVDLPDGRTVRYTADAAGRRVERWVEDADGEEEPDSYRRYVYKDQLNPIAVLDRNGDILQRFVYGSRAHVPDYMVTPDGTFAFVTDHLGSVRFVVDTETGEVAQRMEFDAFGQVLQDTAEGFQPFGFAGGLYEPETGLVRFGARDYDPTTGRWTAKDPIGFDGGDSNLYGYALQDPVNLIDPVGRISHKFWNNTAHVAAGFGDTISFGATRKIRQALDIDAVVDRCSGAYRGGELAGEAHGLVGGGPSVALVRRLRVGRYKKHLDRRHLDAARRETAGEVVARKPDGTPFNHMREVNEAMDGLSNTVQRLQRRLGHPSLSQQERATVQRELSEGSKLLDFAKKYLAP